MKKIITLTVLTCVSLLICTFAFIGCAGSQPAQQTTTGQTITLDEALEKSAAARQKIIDAKKTYEAAKAVDNATGASDKAADGIKKAVTEKIDTTKKQVKDEANAWKEAFK